jgi:hypothetical protein
MRRWGRLVSAWAVILSVLAGADGPASGFVSLFDGKTLDGWTPEHADRIAVRRGAIAIAGGTGWLRSDRPYRDFELRAEYRALRKGADSGIFFRAGDESTAKSPHWPARAYQLEVIDAGSNFQVFGHGTRPPRSERRRDALARAMKGPGQWQAITLRVVGNRTEAELNGVLITVSDAIALPEGYIGLQAENGPFEWRNLEIRELPAP